MAGRGYRAFRLPGTALILAATLLAAGCISAGSPQLDEPFTAATDLTAPCAYYYPLDSSSVMYRSERVFGSGWSPARDFDLEELETTVRNLPVCPRAEVEPEVHASIRAYYLEYTEKVSRALAVAGHLWSIGMTLGLVPLPHFEWYAVCVEVTAPDGLDRRGIATGKAHAFENVWGGIRKEADDAVVPMLQQLAVQAWQNAWTAPMVESQSVLDCPNQLEAIRKGDKPEQEADAR